MAYGTTGSGKSFAMDGADNGSTDGCFMLACKHLFSTIASDKAASYTVQMSHCEIYMEEVRDLLEGGNKCEVKDGDDKNAYVQGLTSRGITGLFDAQAALVAARQCREAGAAEPLNIDPNRSHCIMTLTVTKAGASPVVGKLHLCDLAGSEKLDKTGLTPQQKVASTKIEMALNALSNVMTTLASRSGKKEASASDAKADLEIYRSSKLTRLLQQSLGGNTRTVMLAVIGPSALTVDDTARTLRFAQRGKKVMSKCLTSNVAPATAALKDEVATLKQRVSLAQGKEVVVEKGADQEELNQIKNKHELLINREMLKQRNAKTKLDSIKDTVRTSVSELDRAQQENEESKAKLASMSKVIQEGAAAKSEATMTDIEIRRAQYERKDQERNQRRMQADVDSMLQAQQVADEKYQGIQDEVDTKTKKLKKLWTKLHSVKTEMSDVQDEFYREREDMLDTIRELTRQIRLRQLIMDTFVPAEDLFKVEKRAYWDGDSDQWVLRPLDASADIGFARQKRPVAMEGGRRPASDSNTLMRLMGDPNPRFRMENVAVLELDPPDRMTSDLTGQDAGYDQYSGAYDSLMSEGGMTDAEYEAYAIAMMQGQGAMDDQYGGRPAAAGRPTTARTGR